MQEQEKGWDKPAEAAWPKPTLHLSASPQAHLLSNVSFMPS